MIRPDFSDIQKNGFRINQFRLIHSMSSKAFNNLKEGYVSSGNLIMERDVVVSYLTENNEINFTLYYVTLRLMFLLIFATSISLISKGPWSPLTIILASLSIIFFFISRKYRQYFFFGNFGIEFALSIYNCKVNSKYNF
jgi:hypothetical protein